MVKTYEPFERGPHPVGVSSSSWGDTDRGCSLDVEIWYPAAETPAGQDLDEATQDQFVVPGLSGEEGSTASQSAVRDAEALAEDCCPSCGVRRMVETAAHLVDHVLPRIPALSEETDLSWGFGFRSVCG